MIKRIYVMVMVTMAIIIGGCAVSEPLPDETIFDRITDQSNARN